MQHRNPVPFKAWIGGTYEASEDEWKWATGNCSFGNFGAPWDTNQPDNWAGNENCLVMTSGGKWNDDQCVNMWPFFCQF